MSLQNGPFPGDMFIFRGGNSYQLFELLEVHRIPWWFAQKNKIPYKHTEIQALLSRIRAIQVIIQVYVSRYITTSFFRDNHLAASAKICVPCFGTSSQNMISSYGETTKNYTAFSFLALGKTEKMVFQLKITTGSSVESVVHHEFENFSQTGNWGPFSVQIINVNRGWMSTTEDECCSNRGVSFFHEKWPFGHETGLRLRSIDGDWKNDLILAGCIYVYVYNLHIYIIYIHILS